MVRLTLVFTLLTLLLPTPARAQLIMVEGTIRVQVEGLVRRPGVYRLFQGSRTAEALQAAGGPRPGASLEGLNLAATLMDGERVVVTARGASPARVDARSTPRAPLSLNRASAEELDRLPGIGPSLAADIVAYRRTHGRIQSLDELREIAGIGERRLARLRPLLQL